MEYEKKLPVLVVPEGEMDFGGKSFDEPKIVRCENCGNAMFYLAQRYGLVEEPWRRSDEWKVVGETEESKAFRSWEIGICSEERLCAVCKMPNGLIAVAGDEEIAHEFEDQWEVERHEKALDILKYPNEVLHKNRIHYEREIENIKKWIKERYELNDRIKVNKEKTKDFLMANSVEVARSEPDGSE
jgi:hypothetical protein